MKGKLLKKLKSKALAGFLAGALAINGCANLRNHNIEPFVEGTIDFQITSPQGKISNVPETLRTVKIHPDDGYAQKRNNGPIKEDSARMPLMMEVRFLKAGLESKLNDKKKLQVYVDLSLNLSNFWSVGREVNKRNYTNHPGEDTRGYGAALTYWTTKYGPVLIPGIKAEYQFSKSKKWNSLIGVGYRQYNLEIETGWDRYNSLEKHDDHKIAKITEKTVYIGFNEKDSATFIRFGLNFNDYKAKDKYKGIKIKKKNPSYFFSLGFQKKF